MSSFLRLLLLVCLLTAGCNTDEGKDATPKASAQGGRGGADASPKDASSAKASQVDSVDLLFVMDKSVWNRRNQKAVRDELGRLIQVLSSGDRDPSDGVVEKQDFTPAKSLHLAVVSSNLGLPMIAARDNIDARNCVGVGDDGKFLSVPHETIEGSRGTPLGCEDSYPAFLNFTAGDDVQSISTDFQCIAGIGPVGCGFEQQLEAGLKALWPAKRYKDLDNAFNQFGDGKVKAPVVFLGESETVGGNGDSTEQAGFLRGAPYYVPASSAEEAGMSVLAVVFVSEEDDCSIGALGNMDLLVSSNSAKLPAFLKNPADKASKVNLRCFYDNELPEDQQYRYPVERYIAGFKSLRGVGAERLTVFGALVGVPVDAIKDNLDSDGDGEVSDAEANSYFDSILNHPMMQQVEDPTSGGGKGGYLRDACRTENPDYDASAAENMPEAYPYLMSAEPGVRFVQVAAAFGKNGVVRSVCEEKFTKAMDQIIDAIVANFPKE
jgi:hypothetical protein